MRRKSHVRFGGRAAETHQQTMRTGRCGPTPTPVYVARARTYGANMSGAMSAPSDAAVERAEELFARAKANHLWCQTGGREGKPAVFDKEDLRPLADRLRGLRLSAMSAKGAIMVGLDLTGAHLQGAHLDGADLRGVRLRDADARLRAGVPSPP